MRGFNTYKHPFLYSFKPNQIIPQLNLHRDAFNCAQLIILIALLPSLTYAHNLPKTSHKQLFTLKLINGIINLISPEFKPSFEIAEFLSANGCVDARKAFLVKCNQALRY